MSDPTVLYARALVWDQTFPATPACGSWRSHMRVLERMKASGYRVVSITVAYDPEDSTIRSGTSGHGGASSTSTPRSMYC